MTTCATCGATLPGEARFCMRCGTPVAVPAQPAGERKVITALFCDLVGSTELADRLDPEEVDRLLRAYHGIARRRIQAYGGSVEKFIGDAVVGVFGVPSAHEDDPERAVRAALRLIDEIRASDLHVHVRIGICTGETLVRTDLDRDAGEGFATGDTLNVAARLQNAAPIDGVAAAESTHRACAAAFDWMDLGNIALKGRAEPMHTWQPTSPVIRRPDDAVAEATPFVGRDHELDTLARMLDRAEATPSLEVVTIVAEPGMGKSRLVRELRRHVERHDPNVIWRSGRCLPYGDGIGFWALSEMIASQAGILETDDQETVASKLDDALTPVEPAVRGWMKERLGPLVGLDVSGTPPREDESFAAWRLFLEAIARTAPLALLVEDLHWADDSFVRFLVHLTAATAGLPILLVVTTRPEIEDRHPSWLARARRSTVLSLGSLSGDSVRTLVRAALPDAPDGLITRVLERAAGSPLYAEQLAAMLREQGDGGSAAVDATIPSTIQALLAARIDALPAALKPVLMDASVIGRTFWSGAVATLESRDVNDLAQALVDLSHRELARPSFPSSMEGESEFAFWHALVRDVAYGSIPRSARAGKHLAAAAWIAGRSGASAGRTAEIVAEHYGRALELAVAADAPAIRDSLVDALIAAADHSRQTSPSRASAHASRALELLSADDPRRPTVASALGMALADAGSYAAALATLEQARVLLLEQGGEAAAAAIAVPLAALLADTGDAERAVAIRSEARAALEGTPGPALLAVMGAQAMAESRSGRVTVARVLGQEAVDAAEELGLEPPATALMALGGDDNYARAVAVADGAGDLRAASRTRTNRVIHFRGPATTWMQMIDDAVEFDRAHGIANLALLNVRGYNRFFYLADAGGVVEDLEAVMAEALDIGDRFTATLVRSTLVEIRSLRGDVSTDLDLLAEEWEAAGLGDGLEVTLAQAAMAAGEIDRLPVLMATFLETASEVEIPWIVVDACARAGDLDAAARIVDVAREEARLHPASDGAGRRLRAAEDDLSAGRLSEGRGDHAGARERYERAWRVFERNGWDMPMAMARGWLARCLVADGDTDRAAPHLAASRAIAERAGLKPWLASLVALEELMGADAMPDAPRLRPSM